MHTGQTLLTILAFMMLSTVLTNFYRQMDNVGDSVDEGQDGILATSINTSYQQIAERMSFDDATRNNDIRNVNGNMNLLTDPSVLGRETGEDTITDINDYNDFDDFNGKTFYKTAYGTNRTYATHFVVQYVDSTDISRYSGARTYVKRMDMSTWRTIPPGGNVDTVRMSVVMGHFTFQ